MPLVVPAFLFPLACGSDVPVDPGPPKPEAIPALFYSPAAYCQKGRTGDGSLLLLNQGDADLVWSPIRVPAWVFGLDDEIRLGPGEATEIDWTWASPPGFPYSDSVVVTTNDPDHRRVRIVLENVPASTQSSAPPAPLLALPADSARFAVGDTIVLGWQEVGGCNAVAYRVQIAVDEEFRQVVCCDGFIEATAAELIVEQGDEGRAWWRIVPRWVGGIVGPPGPARTWLVE